MSTAGSVRVSDTRTSADLALSRRLVPGTLLASRYRIEAQIGAGGMGVVYRAHDVALGIDIALKVLRPDLGGDPEWAERFRRELLLAREVTHRNVVRIHDLGECDGLHFLTMRLIEGRSLREILEAEGPLPLPRALAIFRQLAQALEQAHSAGIVHRDLKPGNVLLSPDDTAYITDFGIARSLDDPGLTRSGVVVGTFDYLSPEQVAGDPVDQRSDIYALGILLYEMVSGQLPFRSHSRAEALVRRMVGRARDLADAGVRAPAYVRRLLRRCLARNAADRYSSVRELLHDLQQQRAGIRDRLPRRALPLLAATLLLASSGLALRHWEGRPAGPVAAPAPAPTSVAVLPLTNETGDADLTWASSGLAEMLTAQLAESPQLRVLDSARVLRTLADLGFSPNGTDQAALTRLADLLEARRIVTGSLRRAGRTLRLDLQLRSVVAGRLESRAVGAETREADGLFRLVSQLGDRLRAELGVAPPRDPPGARPATTNVEAARAYREGRERLVAGDSLHAAPAFQRAVAADAGFAAALEGLSEADEALGRHDEAVAAAERAAALVGDSQTRLAWRVRARLALLRGDPAGAEKAYGELLRLYPNDTEALLNLAAAQARQGAVARAIPTLERVTELDKSDARAWFLLGKNMILAGDTLKAVGDPLLRALTLMTQLGNEQGRGDVLNAMGVAYQRLGRYPEAVDKYGEAASIRRSIGDERGTAVSLRNRASIHLALGRDTDAEPDLRASRDIYLRIGDRKGLAEVWNDFGALHEGRGDYPRARGAYQEALRIRRGLGDQQQLAQSYDNLGYAYFLEGEQARALLHCQQALDLRRTIGDKGGVVRSLQNLGFIHTAQGRLGPAMKEFLDAMEKAREIDFANALAVSHGNIGLLHQYEGRYDSALSSYAEALRTLGRLGDRRGLVEFTLKEAQALLELGRHDLAKARLDAASSWLAGDANREQASDYQVLLGLWHSTRGDAGAARAAFESAVERATASRGRSAVLRARIARDSLPGSAGEAAVRALLSAVQEADALGDVPLRIRAGESLARAQLAAGRLGQAEAAARQATRLAGASGFESVRYRLHALLAAILARKGDALGAEAEYGESARALDRLRGAIPRQHQRAFDTLSVVREVRAWKAERLRADAR